MAVHVALDVMGGDLGPGELVAGAVQAVNELDVEVTLLGDANLIDKALAAHPADKRRIRTVHTSQVITMEESPFEAVRRKKDASVVKAFGLLKEGGVEAVVSAGNSGATMAAGMFVLKRIPGIDRPAIATIMPNIKDKTLVLDVGGNVDCKPLHLVQFALMGEVYTRRVLGKERPKVGLLSNGEEESKGNDLTREAHRLLKSASFNYVGYVEGRDIYNGSVDVVVCDGFVGNVVLKVAEGLSEGIFTMLRKEIGSRPLAKIGYLLARPAFQAFRKRVDYSEYGGAPLLGIDGTGVICHGGSSPKAIMNAVHMSREYVVKKVNQTMTAQIQEYCDGQAGAVDATPATQG